MSDSRLPSGPNFLLFASSAWWMEFVRDILTSSPAISNAGILCLSHFKCGVIMLRPFQILCLSPINCVAASHIEACSGCHFAPSCNQFCLCNHLSYVTADNLLSKADGLNKIARAMTPSRHNWEEPYSQIRLDHEIFVRLRDFNYSKFPLTVHIWWLFNHSLICWDN